MIIINDIDQRTEEWFKIRAGIPSASEFHKIVKQNGDPSDQRKDYLLQLAGERITGLSENGYVSWDMRRGAELEDEARLYYGFLTGDEVKQVGFVFLDQNRAVGCSPDGLIYDPKIHIDDPVSGLELRCGKMKVHVSQLLDRELPKDKWQQVQGSMWVCGFHSWEFMAYHPKMPALHLTIQRDYKFTSALEYEMEAFLQELDEVHKELLEKTTE